jgi:ABC-type branched-subunit amino acid transport system substrate-binding protein
MLLVDDVVNEALREEPGLSVLSLELSGESDLTEHFKALIRSGVTVNFLLSSNLTRISNFLKLASDVYGMYDDGNAWIVVGVDPKDVDIFTAVPAGTLFVSELEIARANFPSFKQKLASLPGSSGSVESQSAHILDSIKVIGSAIKTAKSSSVTRTNVRNIIASSTFSGVSGTIEFESVLGFRKGSWAEVINTVPQGSNNKSYTTVFSWDGANNDLSSTDTQVVFPGPSLLPPTSTEVIYNLVWLIKDTDVGLPSAEIPAILQYGTDVVNNVSNATYDAPRLPRGHRMRMVTIQLGPTETTAIPATIPMPSYGVIGALTSGVSSMAELIQNLLSPYGVVHFGSTETAPALSNKEEYPTFLRNVPPDDKQGASLINLAVYYKWTEVGVVYTSESYGAGIFQVIQSAAREQGVTLSTVATLDVGQSSYVNQLTTFAKEKPRVVLMLLDPDTIAPVLRSFKELSYQPQAIVGSDSLSYVLEAPSLYDMSDTELNGFIATLPSGGFGEKYEAFKAELQAMPDDSAIKKYHEITATFATLLIDSLFNVADAMTRLINQGVSPKNTTALYKALLATDAYFLTGETHFDSNGDRIGTYSIMNHVSGAAKLVGRIEEGSISLDEPVVWLSGNSEIPLSTLPRTQKWLDWKDPAGIVFTIIAVLGIATCIFMFVILVHQKDSPVVRVATWQFLLLMLFGAALGYGSILTWIGKPQPYICALRIWLPPMAFILIMAPLLTKTWRLHKIFTLADLKVAPIPLWRLVVMCSAIAFIQLVICIFWISMGTIKPSIINDANDKTVAYVTCGMNKANRISAYVTYGYLGFLMLVGCYLTFRVRKLPKDFNESRWIGLSIYNTLLFSIIILILGYALNKFPVTVLILSCVCTFAIATGAICFMMAPKLWTLLMHPEKRSSSSANSTKMTTGRPWSKRTDYSRSVPSKGTSKDSKGSYQGSVNGV